MLEKLNQLDQAIEIASTIDGTKADHILLAPPSILENAHIDEITGKLAKAFGSVF